MGKLPDLFKILVCLHRAWDGNYQWDKICGEDSGHENFSSYSFSFSLENWYQSFPSLMKAAIPSGMRPLCGIPGCLLLCLFPIRDWWTLLTLLDSLCHLLMRWRNTALWCLCSSRAFVCTWGWKVCFSSLSNGKHWVTKESSAFLNTICDFYFNHWTLHLAGQAVKWTQGCGGSHESFSAVLVLKKSWHCLANLKSPLGSLKEQWAGCSCSISAWSLTDAPLVWQNWIYRLMMVPGPQCE